MENIYKTLHENPELSGKEFNTSKFIKDYLKVYDVTIYSIGLSVICFFNKNKNECIAFRSEIDGLPIIENDHKIKSKNLNMHACGHDIHTAALLKSCDYISTTNFKYNISLIFQSKEETGLGSVDIVNSGIIKKLNIVNVFGMHVWPNLDFNKIYSNKFLMYGSYELDITITGKSNHISTYNKMLDPIYCSNLLYNKINKFRAFCFAHLGKINAGIIRNITAERCTMEYSVRFKKDCNMKRKITNIKVKSMCDVKYHFNSYYPVLKNDTNLLKVIPHEKIKQLKSVEDFGYYSFDANVLFLLFGLGKANNLHTNSFETTEEQRSAYYEKLLFIMNKFEE